MSDSPDPERDLDHLLANMAPELLEGRFVFVDGGDPVAGRLDPEEIEGSIREPEGQSYLVSKEVADREGLSYDFVAAWIILKVESALDAVGLTAAVSSRLAEAGISCNVVAALRHDHLLVPGRDSERALAVLRMLSDQTSP